jgi:tRNA dimethylallyltransferase
LKSKTIIIIAGPTAVGKTSVAIEIAKHFQTEIISADSRQCYRELHIGVAKPTSHQINQVKHHFINSHSIHEVVTAASFEQYALQAADEIFKSRNIAIMVGGTGLYIKAFSVGLDEIPEVHPDIRNNIISAYNSSGLSWLQDEVKKNDPTYFSGGEILNPQRLIRALEVKLATGKSIREFQVQKKAIREFDIINVALELPKSQLHLNINKRVEDMMKAGLLQEVASLQPYKHLAALHTVGYSELFRHLEGEISLDEATELIKKNTRLYAKRQLTWFRKEQSTKWYHPSQISQIIDLYQEK